MIKTIEGIVLSDLEYGETSKILKVLSKEHGVISIISKGCRSGKSNLCSVSQKLTYGYFQIHYKKNKLSILKSVDLIDSFKMIRQDIIKISYAMFLLDLIEQAYRENEDIKLFDLLINGMKKINQGFDAQVISFMIELQLLNYLGVKPILDYCITCQSSQNIKTISIKKAGFVCSKCFTDEKIYAQETLKMLRMLFLVDVAKISKINVEKTQKSEIKNFLNDYYQDYTGIFIKKNDFFDKFDC